MTNISQNSIFKHQGLTFGKRELPMRLLEILR